MSVFEEIICELPDDASAIDIESTAHDLECLNYEPILFIKTPTFLRMTKAELMKEINRVLALPAEEASDAFKTGHIELLFYHFELLTRLRLQDAEAWDQVNELYVDD
jgi:predicted phage gp36 major capsid-like protein